jgi:hypothetical protein
VSDPYQEAFDDVLCQERKRKSAWVLGCVNAFDGIRVFMVDVVVKRRRKAVVRPLSADKTWIVDSDRVYPTRDNADAALRDYLQFPVNLPDVI